MLLRSSNYVLLLTTSSCCLWWQAHRFALSGSHGPHMARSTASSARYQSQVTTVQRDAARYFQSLFSLSLARSCRLIHTTLNTGKEGERERDTHGQTAACTDTYKHKHSTTKSNIQREREEVRKRGKRDRKGGGFGHLSGEHWCYR